MKTELFLQQELQKITSQLKNHLREKNERPLHFTFERLNLTELLNHVICEKVFYFKSKYSDFCYLGLGQSLVIEPESFDQYITENPNHYIASAFSFENENSETNLFLPEWIFISKNGKTELSIHPSFHYKNFSLPNLFFNAQFDLNLYDPIVSLWESYEELPEHDQWEKIIAKANQCFEDGSLLKIALSRKKIFGYHEPVPPITFFKAILEQNNFEHSSYVILHQISFDKAFISFTPEKLFAQYGLNVDTISLAASAPRGITEEEDIAFERTLKNSSKLINEHALVTDEIVKRLHPISKSVKVFELETMKLPYIQHQSAPIRAELLQETSPLNLVRLLHPTPAVGGLPWKEAQIKIQELEPYSRKSYAAPIGVMSSHFSELAVGIRSALIEGKRVTLFGGAGIVKGSVAEEEWIETGIKMNPFIKVINP